MRRLVMRGATAAAGAVSLVAGPANLSATTSATAAMMACPATMMSAARFQSSNRGGNAPTNFAHLPPAFDIPRWNEDKSKGYCLRVSYTENCVLLTYINQRNDLPSNDVPKAPAGGSDEHQSGSMKANLRGDRLVSVYLPNVYIARFLAVLEGAMEKCDIASRQTTGTFTPSTEPHSFRLACKSVVGKDTLEWTTEFDAPAALMLQRFLTQSLHYNNGFLK